MLIKLKNRLPTALALFASAFALLIAAGCTTSKTMYGWNDYQPELYRYFQGSNAEEQIIKLEKNLEQFKARDQLAPPGFHAHLGMLYAQVGNLDRAAEEFNIEKKRFPESGSYMDFLLKNGTPKSVTMTSNNKNAANPAKPSKAGGAVENFSPIPNKEK